jgi:hypothetical protein
LFPTDIGLGVLTLSVIRIDVPSRAIAASLGITDKPTPWKGLGTHGLTVAGCYLDELHAGGEPEFGVDVGEVGLHGAR